MIKINDNIVVQDAFGDGTLKCETPKLLSGNEINITWCYDTDSELFTLICLTNYIKDQYSRYEINLTMPYIPHARQDREVSGKLFTLKYFAKIINSLNFDNVYVYDPHSEVSCALIDRIRINYEAFFVSYTDVAVMYPDAGAAKKYMNKEDVVSPIIGNKQRNGEGRITSYELLNFNDNIKNVIIRDDICSYGGTFVAAAKELRKRGVEEIILVVTHCENNILKGDVFNYVDKVYTTDSIFTETHPKVRILRKFR